MPELSHGNILRENLAELFSERVEISVAATDLFV
jgi:hypothetical protein